LTPLSSYFLEVMARGRLHPKRDDAGFTIIELIVIMMIVGILAVAVIPRFSDRSTFDSRGTRDGLLSALRYAQKSAIAQRRYVCVSTGATTTVTYETTYTTAGNINCTGNVNLPTGDVGCSGPSTGNRVCAPSTVTVDTASIYFSPLGRPVNSDRSAASSDVTIGVSGASANILVEKETGYVR
jgi:MSHA pilin protein MshC